jgi:hypothetical protein
MARAKPKPAEDRKPLVVEAEKGDTEAQSMARAMVGPYLRHGILANGIADKMVGKLPGEPRFDDYAHVIKRNAEQLAKGDLTLASEMLAAQAHSLDAMFTEMARRAAMNMGDYIQASERYARLALKAQANSRATLEALVRLHQPREQIVKHVHVNEGGQAVVADNFHSSGPAETPRAEMPSIGPRLNVRSATHSYRTAPYTRPAGAQSKSAWDGACAMAAKAHAHKMVAARPGERADQS